ncbi:MAG TPA: hypothetical protein VMS76_13590 [Planctomycetota bacterium]|nr:hypothetical protein [Planctomycetota bacterium]
MEEVVFREQPVKKILEDHYVEARLHMDVNPPPRNEEVRLQFGATRTLPNFLTVEPHGEVRTAVHPGPQLDPRKFARWLEEGLENARRGRSAKAAKASGEGAGGGR